MTREWFTANEIAGKAGMPSTPRRVRDKAKRERWDARKRLKGKGFEYSASSLPRVTRNALVDREESHAFEAGVDQLNRQIKEMECLIRRAESVRWGLFMTRDAYRQIINARKIIQKNEFDADKAGAD